MTEKNASELARYREFFRDIRKFHGITQSDVARATESQFRQKTVSQFESGETVGPETAQQFIDALLKLLKERTAGDQEDGLGAVVGMSTERMICIDGENGNAKAEMLKLHAKNAEELARYAADSPIDIRCSVEKGHDWIGADAPTKPLLAKLDETLAELIVARNNRRHKNPSNFTEIVENEIQVAEVAEKIASALLDLGSRLQWNLLARHNGTHNIATVVLAVVKNTKEPMKVSFNKATDNDFVKKVDQDRRKMMKIEGDER